MNNQNLMFHHKAQCHCGNIQAEILFSEPTSQFAPRACDCDFCMQHGAAYISDRKGRLHFHFQKKEDVSRYQQGSAQAEFLICRICGVLAGVIYQEENNIYAALNRRFLGNEILFLPEQTVSPKLLKPKEKTKRWKEVWFPNVKLD